MPNDAEFPPIAYTRNGFVGPFTIMAKSLYPVSYSSVIGSYAPRTFALGALASSFFEGDHRLPVAILAEPATNRLSIEAFHRDEAMSFALRNVFADELHIVFAGSARLETEFGILNLSSKDLVLIPRAVSYRIVEVRGAYRSAIVASETPLSLAMTPGNGPLKSWHLPEAWPDLMPRSGKYEVVIRHGCNATSVFYDQDPLPGELIAGPPVVYKVNMEEVGSVELVGGAGMLLPAALFHDQTTCNLVFNLSSRKTNRPDVHYNADYDELVLYLGGEAGWGALTTPGMLSHTPKGFPHQGPAEEVAGGYTAILVETRCNMELTEAGRNLGRLVVADQFSLHPSELEREAALE